MHGPRFRSILLNIVNRWLIVHRRAVSDKRGHRFESIVEYAEQESVAPLFASGHPVKAAQMLPPKRANP